MHKSPESRYRSRFGAAGIFIAPLLAGAVAGACAGPTRDPAPRENVAVAKQNLVTCVTIQRGTFGAVEDATITANVTTPGWNTATLRAGGQLESLLRFDLGSIPANASVNSATLSLTTTNTVSNQWLFANVAAAPWSESTVTFASFDQQLGKSAGIMTPSAANTVQSLSVNTKRVQGWVNGTLPNYGIVLQTMVSMPSNYKESAFVSSESPTVSLRPALEVCYTPFDYCAEAPCQNGAACQSNATGYTCACAPGYTGADCEINIDDCAGNPCQNGGACADGVSGYTCACAPGFAGAHCETDINECAPAPCQNGGVCSDLVNGYACSCPPGFTGTSCETDIDDCAGNPCQNGGACTDGTNGYTCACPPGFAGTSCETNIDDCAGNACQNGSTCVDGVGGYTCACAPGFTGAHCETNIDECAGNPCQNGGACTDGTNGYACACAPGYTGTNCEIDINECAPQPCQNGSTCIDGVNGYTCQCADGWMGALCDIATSSAPTTLDVVPGAASAQVLTAPGMQVVVPAGVDVQMNGVPVTGSIALTAEMSSDPSQAFLLPSSEEEADATGYVMPDSAFTVYPTYRFGPAGATFNPPLQATVVVPSGMNDPTAYLCDDDGTNCRQRAGIFYQDTSVSPPQSKLYIEIDHFSVLVLTDRVPSGISYGWGPVMRGTPNIYYIWYGDWSGNTAPTILTDLAQNISGSPHMLINTAYSDGNGNVSGNVSYGGSVDVAASNTYGYLSLSRANVEKLVSDVITTGKLPKDANGIYFVLTAANVDQIWGSTSRFCQQYCGWHTYADISGTSIKYSFVGNPTIKCPDGCQPQTTSPNGNAGADSMAKTIVHEIVETLTDPELDAWSDASGNENADKCSWRYGNTSRLANNAMYNVTLGTRKYLLQQNWDPVAGACVMSAQATAGFPAPDGTDCNDGNACTQTDEVASAVCTGYNPKVCPAPDQCHLAGVCAPSTGACSSVAKANGTPCNDGNSATLMDTCQNGTCTGSPPDVTCGSGACQVLSASPSSSSSTSGCQTYTHKTATFTRSSGTPHVLISGNAAGTLPPDFDELAVVTVTSPTKQVRKTNLVRWQPNCSDTSAPTIQLTGSGAAVNISSLFGSETGTFIVDIAVRGFANPYSWSNTYLLGTSDPCAGVVCTASDACHVAGTCNPSTGQCNNPVAPDGTSCSDSDACTTSDTCQSGICTGALVTYDGAGPQHWWRGDGNTSDAAGGATGAVSGGVTYATGPMNQGFSFNGTGLVASSSAGAYPGSGPLTITAWIKTTTTGVAQEIVNLYECGGACPGGISTAHIDLSITTAGKLTATLRGSTNVTKMVTGAVTITDGQFHQVALVRDTAASLLRIFVDGAADGTVAIPVDNIYDSDGETDPIQIGAKRNAASTSSAGFFYGIIDDVRWFQASLTAAEMFNLTCQGDACTGTPVCEYGPPWASCLSILNAGASTGSGVYTIDPDGLGGNAAFQVYCDMTTDGGGWTLALAYNHVGTQNNALVNGVPLDPETGYSHMSNTQMAQLASYTSARFYCDTMAHARVMHFKTSNAGALGYIRDGVSNAAGNWSSGFTLLSGHTANLPAQTANVFTGKGNSAMTEFPFWRSGYNHWGIRGSGTRWECDDYPNNANNSTHHQVWVR